MFHVYTTPYFHKDTLIPPSSSRSPPLEGGGPSTHAGRDASLYNARPLLRDLHDVHRRISYEAFVCVCVCSSCIKHDYAQPFIWLLWNTRSGPYVCLYIDNNFILLEKIIIKLHTKKYCNKNEKPFSPKKVSKNEAAKNDTDKRNRDIYFMMRFTSKSTY